jgi:hypothetical protein
MDGLISISYDDVIETVLSNEKVIDKKTVKRVFKEILNQQLENANYSLDQHMEKIIKDIKSSRDE